MSPLTPSQRGALAKAAPALAVAERRALHLRLAAPRNNQEVKIKRFALAP